MFSSVRQGGLLGLSRRVFCSIAAKGFLLRYGFCSIAAGLCRFALAQAAKAFHFFCPNKRNETKKIRRLHFFAYSGTFLR